MSKYPAPSPQQYPAAEGNYGGPQDPTNGLIVLHSMVYPCKPGAVEAVGGFFSVFHPDNPTSAHYGVDPVKVGQYVPDHRIAYHCGHNTNSLGVEMADMSTTDITRWEDKAHVMMMQKATLLVAQLCLAYNIRPYYVGWIRLKLGIKGVTTHAQMTKAFRQSTHTDPGAWPRKVFMRKVRENIRIIKAGK